MRSLLFNDILSRLIYNLFYDNQNQKRSIFISKIKLAVYLFVLLQNVSQIAIRLIKSIPCLTLLVRILILILPTSYVVYLIYIKYMKQVQLFFSNIFSSSTQSVGSLDIFYVPFQNFLNPSKRTATIGPLFRSKNLNAR